MQSSLLLDNLSVTVKLGCTPQEREFPQLIRLNIRLDFQALPDATTTDDLNNTVCYAQLSQKIQSFCSERSFNLLESLGYEIYRYIETMIPNNIKIALRVIKNPPVVNLERSIFTIGHWYE